MAHHVFIRRSIKDEPVSDTGRATMGARGIRRRTAPSDIPPCVDRRAAMVDATGAIRVPIYVVPCFDRRAAIVDAIRAPNGMGFEVPR